VIKVTDRTPLSGRLCSKTALHLKHPLCSAICGLAADEAAFGRFLPNLGGACAAFFCLGTAGDACAGRLVPAIDVSIVILF
jgi:hypothetical protein